MSQLLRISLLGISSVHVTCSSSDHGWKTLNWPPSPEEKEQLGWMYLESNTIEYIDEATYSQRMKNRLNEHINNPFIMRFLAESPMWQEFLETFKRPQLIKKFGQHKIGAGTSFALTATGDPNFKMKLKEFLDTSMSGDRSHAAGNASGEAYVFDHSFLKKAGFRKKLTSKGNPLAATVDVHDAWIFALGTDGHGLGFHRHTDSYAFQFYGVKRWALYAPGQMTPTGFALEESFAVWLKNRRGGEGFKPPTWEFIQLPGEVVFVPEGFYHATLCLGDSVAIVGQMAKYTKGTAGWYDEEAQQKLMKGRHKEAVKLVNEALLLDPGNPALEKSLCLCQPHLKAADALACWQKALDANPLDKLSIREVEKYAKKVSKKGKRNRASETEL